MQEILPDKDQRSICISHLDIRYCIIFRLKAVGINTLQEFSQMFECQQKSIKKIGERSLNILWDLCDQYGLQRFDDSLSELPVYSQKKFVSIGITLKEFSRLTSVQQQSRTGLTKENLQILREICLRKGLPMYCECSLSARAQNLLIRAGLTIEEFALKDDFEINKIRGAGKVTVSELKAYCKALNLLN